MSNENVQAPEVQESKVEEIKKYVAGLDEDNQTILIDEALNFFADRAEMEQSIIAKRNERLRTQVLERNGFVPEKIEELKKQHVRGIFWLTFKGRLFIYRSPSRTEYSQLAVQFANMSREESEALVSEKFVIYAESRDMDGKQAEYTAKYIEEDHAGIPSILSDEIMDSCGFAPDFSSQKL